jgi:HAD superfamily hydrolase (TIGR01509 family)
MGLRALLFDVDGTLADTEETHRQAFNAAFLQFELPWEWSPQLYGDLLKVSGGKGRIESYIDTLRVAPAERARLKQLVPGIHRTKTRLYGELIADGRSPLRPGVGRLLREARGAGLKLAIASTTTGANVQALIRRHLGGTGFSRFDVIACGDQVSAKKPAPDIYSLALASLGLPAAACVAFEDSANGLRAAKAAGLFTIVTPTPWTAGQDFAGADLRLSHLGDPGQPLSAAERDRIGGPWLGLAQLEALHARRLRAAEPQEN